MRDNYCTLFDSNFLSRGLAMYNSLKKTTKDFHLYIYPFDEEAEKILIDLELENVTLVPLKEFEDNKLLEIKTKRSPREYYWTCTPSVILHSVLNYNLPVCTYLDADLFFYSDPKILINELIDSKKSVLITEHRYTPEYDQSATSGIYCVQFITFMNNAEGLEVLNWWRDACIEWCYARCENGKFGDQKYLDDWPQRFPSIHVLQHLGGGVAPWNVQQYRIYFKNGRLLAINKTDGLEFEIVFFHFHNLKFLHGDKLDLGNYYLSPEVKEYIYKPYIKKLEEIKEGLNIGQVIPEIEKFDWKLNIRKFRQKLLKEGFDWKFYFRKFKMKLLKENIFDKRKFLGKIWLK